MILVAIIAAGILFVRLTAAPKNAAQAVAEEDSPSAPDHIIAARTYITLSGQAEKVVVEGAEGPIIFEGTSNGIYSGEVGISEDAPLVSVKVSWKGEAVHHFVKMVIEAPGKKTFTHVFDAPGDIDDFVELVF